MPAVTRLLVLILAVAALVLSGCKPTVENQSAAWTANAKTIKELTAQYPGFKPALTARMKTAEDAKAKADGLSGEAAAEALQAANRTLMGGFVGQLKGLDDKLDKLRKKTVEVAAAAGDPSSRMAAKLAAEDATKTMDRIAATLKAGAKDDASADAVLAKVTKDLDAAAKAVDAVGKADKNKKDAKAADAKAADAKAADAKAAAEAKVADWKCEFCDSMNKHDHTKCESCGAPRAKKKADAKAAK